MTFVAAMQMWESIWEIKLQWSGILYSGDLRKSWGSLDSLFSYTFHFVRNSRNNIINEPQHTRRVEKKNCQLCVKKIVSKIKSQCSIRIGCSHWEESHTKWYCKRDLNDRLFLTIYFHRNWSAHGHRCVMMKLMQWIIIETVLILCAVNVLLTISYVWFHHLNSVYRAIEWHKPIKHQTFR